MQREIEKKGWKAEKADQVDHKQGWEVDFVDMLQKYRK